MIIETKNAETISSFHVFHTKNMNKIKFVFVLVIIDFCIHIGTDSSYWSYNLLPPGMYVRVQFGNNTTTVHPCD